MRRKGPILRAFAADFALGLAVALGQAPFGLWPLALAGLALGFRRVSTAATPGAAFFRAWGLGAGHFALALSWIVQPFFVDPVRHGWMAPFALLGMAGGLALFWGAAGWVTLRLRRGAVAFALLLTLAELARGNILTGFPWALPGHIWIDTPLMQLASLTGAYGMTFVTLLALALPLSFGARGGAGAALLLIGAGLWSAHRLSLPEPEPRAGLVRLVQPNIPQTLKWDPEAARANFDRLLRMTAGSGADLVVWPETAVPFLVTPGEGAARAISAAGQPAAVAAGIQRQDGDAAWNTLAVFGPGGSITQSFDKMHLVPFGEYIPMGDLVFAWTGIRAMASQAGAGYTAGTRRDLLDFGPAAGRALPVICYETIFPGEMTATDGARADWIIQITNDAWFGTLTGPYQHFAQARLRAVEQGLPLMRAANTGISAVIDARGRIAADTAGAPLSLPLGAQGVLDAAIPGALPPTPYSRTGDLPLLALLLLGLALCLRHGRNPSR